MQRRLTFVMLVAGASTGSCELKSAIQIPESVRWRQTVTVESKSDRISWVSEYVIHQRDWVVRETLPNSMVVVAGELRGKRFTSDRRFDPEVGSPFKILSAICKAVNDRTPKKKTEIPRTEVDERFAMSCVFDLGRGFPVSATWIDKKEETTSYFRYADTTRIGARAALELIKRQLSNVPEIK